MFLFFLFILGISIGSFLNVLIDRLPREESIGFWTSQNDKKRSYCESCKHALLWYDLIPLLSFVQLRGKCRYCHISLSLYYPIVELITGSLFLITVLFLSYGVIPSAVEGSTLVSEILRLATLAQNDIWVISHLSSLIFHLFIISSLIVIFFTDVKYGIIPDKIIFPAIIITFFFFVLTSEEFLGLRSGPPSEVGSQLLAGIGAFLFFLFLFLVTRGRGMGFGDVKYAFLMGLILGFPNIITALYIAFLTGAFISLILVVWGKKKLKGATIPFGPFLVLATIICLFWGNTITQLALSFLFR